MAYKGRTFDDVDFDSLQVTLVNSKLQQSNPALYLTISQLILKLRKNKDQVNDFFNTIIGDINIDTTNNIQAILKRIVGFADSDILTWTDESANLQFSRTLIAGDGIEFDDTTANQRIISTTYKTASVILTDADIKALPTTPFELIETPGTDKRIALVNADLYIDASAGAYTNINAESSGALRIGTNDISSYFTSDSGPTGTRLADFLGNAAIKQATLLPASVPDIVSGWMNLPNIISAADSLLDEPLELYVDNDTSGDFTGGNVANSLKITVAYLVL